MTISNTPLYKSIMRPSKPKHPYYPQDLHLPGYEPNAWSPQIVVVCFASAIAVSLLLLRVVAGRFLLLRPMTTKQSNNLGVGMGDAACALWFALSGTVHLLLEGYFVFTVVLLKQPLAGRQDLLAMVWKEYALADSRYVSGSDPFLLGVESLTATVWGPLCLLAAGLVLVKSVYRYPVQAVVSVGHLYGCVLYFATSAIDEYYHGKVYSRPEIQYFWLYYVFMNALWIAIPAVLLYSSITNSAKAFALLEEANGTSRQKGEVKKKRL